MSKKTKKSKSPKGGKLPGGSSPRVVMPTYAVDTATALTAYDSTTGAKWTSDVVYDISSENFRLDTGTDYWGKDIVTGWWTKMELTRSLMVETNLITTRTSDPYGSGKWYVERMVHHLSPSSSEWDGNTIKSHADYARLEGRAVGDGEALDYRPLASFMDDTTTLPNGGDINRNFTSIKAGVLAAILGAGYSTGKEDENWFRTYEGGKFFGKDWYLNPFGENLI